MEAIVREPLKEAFKETMDEAEAERRASGSRVRAFVRTVLLVGAATAAGYVLGGRRTPSEMTETTETTSEPSSQSSEGSSGRGLLSKLVILGTVVGIGYAMKSRSGSVDEVVSGATERVQSVAGETIGGEGGPGEQLETAAEEAAETVQEGGEMAAEQIESGGQEVAEQMEAGEEEAEESEAEEGEDGDESEE